MWLSDRPASLTPDEKVQASMKTTHDEWAREHL